MDTEKQFVVMSKKDVEEMIQQAAVAGAQGRKQIQCWWLSAGLKKKE